MKFYALSTALISFMLNLLAAENIPIFRGTDSPPEKSVGKSSSKENKEALLERPNPVSRNPETDPAQSPTPQD
jgi:hypothetical protein